MATEGQAQPTKSLPERISLWTQIIMGIAAIGGMIWAALAFFDPIGDVDVTVRILQEVPVSLPDEAGSLPVELTYEGSRITRALFLGLEISNTGNRPIGADDNRWMLTLRSSSGSKLSLLGKLHPKPENLVVSYRVPGIDRIMLELGLFNPSDVIGLELIIIDPPSDVAKPLVAETRIPGLQQPVVTGLNTQDRLREAFLPPLWIGLWVAFFALMIWEAIEMGNLSIGRGAVAFFLSLFGSAFIAQGMAWVLGAFAAAAIHG